MTYETIREPGKFEGELAIVPKMWDIALEGFACDVFVGNVQYSFVTVCSVEQDSTDENGCVDGLYGACLWEREDGFVMSQWYANQAEYDAAIINLEAEESEEYDEHF